MKIYDISIPLSVQTPVWEGDKGVSITRVATVGSKSDFNISRIEMGVHAGTHIDAPFHTMSDAGKLESIPLEKLVGKTQVVQIPENVKRITAAILTDADIQPGMKKLLFKTRNSKFWKCESPQFRTDFTALDSSAADWLVKFGVELVGLDSFSVSLMDDLVQPHVIMLHAGIVLIENLDLLEVPAGCYDLFCLPLKLVGTEGAPARVILTTPG